MEEEINGDGGGGIDDRRGRGNILTERTLETESTVQSRKRGTDGLNRCMSKGEERRK